MGFQGATLAQIMQVQGQGWLAQEWDSRDKAGPLERAKLDPSRPVLLVSIHKPNSFTRLSVRLWVAGLGCG